MKSFFSGMLFLLATFVSFSANAQAIRNIHPNCDVGVSIHWKDATVPGCTVVTVTKHIVTNGMALALTPPFPNAIIAGAFVVLINEPVPRPNVSVKIPACGGNTYATISGTLCGDNFVDLDPGVQLVTFGDL
ncbi:MAG: hypothetical protein ACFB10_07640 [Salibacteraceae bacterium]